MTKLARISDYLMEDLPDRYGVFGALVGVGVITLLLLIGIIIAFAIGNIIFGPTHDNSIQCTQGHYAQRYVYNAATKTSSMKSYFICDAE